MIREDKKWQHTRLLAWASIQPHSKKRITPRHFYESLFDKGATQVTEEEANEVLKAWKLN